MAVAAVTTRRGGRDARRTLRTSKREDMLPGLRHGLPYTEPLDQEQIARIHDAFIVRDKLSASVLDDIADKWGWKTYLSLDCEEQREWIDPSFKRALINADADLASHRKHIEREEATAQKKAALKRAGFGG